MTSHEYWRSRAVKAELLLIQIEVASCESVAALVEAYFSQLGANKQTNDIVEKP